MTRHDKWISEGGVAPRDRAVCDGAEHWMGTGRRRGGILVLPTLSKVVAEKVRDEYAVQKERRKAREERRQAPTKKDKIQKVRGRRLPTLECVGWPLSPVGGQRDVNNGRWWHMTSRVLLLECMFLNRGSDSGTSSRSRCPRWSCRLNVFYRAVRGRGLCDARRLRDMLGMRWRR